jgi:hypothetical protein
MRPLVLLAYETVHGPLATPLVAATIDPRLCGTLDPARELRRIASRLGITRSEILTDTDVAVQPDLFPSLPERKTCNLRSITKSSIA